MRQRIEDLGRLLEKLSVLKEHKLFNKIDTLNFLEYYLPLDYRENAAEIPQDIIGRFEELHECIYEVFERIVDCHDICSGEDYINRED